MPHCRPDRPGGLPSTASATSEFQASRVFLKDTAFDRPAYHAQESRCLLCDAVFQSYDPRYNRRCPPCQLRVANMSGLAEDDYPCCL